MTSFSKLKGRLPFGYTFLFFFTIFSTVGLFAWLWCIGEKNILNNSDVFRNYAMFGFAVYGLIVLAVAMIVYLLGSPRLLPKPDILDSLVEEDDSENEEQIIQ